MSQQEAFEAHMRERGQGHRLATWPASMTTENQIVYVDGAIQMAWECYQIDPTPPASGDVEAAGSPETARGGAWLAFRKIVARYENWLRGDNAARLAKADVLAVAVSGYHLSELRRVAGEVCARLRHYVEARCEEYGDEDGVQGILDDAIEKACGPENGPYACTQCGAALGECSPPFPECGPEEKR